MAAYVTLAGGGRELGWTPKEREGGAAWRRQRQANEEGEESRAAGKHPPLLLLVRDKREVALSLGLVSRRRDAGLGDRLGRGVVDSRARRAARGRREDLGRVDLGEVLRRRAKNEGFGQGE